MKYANVIQGKYSKEAEVASVAAFEAGRIAMKGLLEAKSRSGDHNNNNTLGVSSKGGIDLVTKYDKACESYIFEFHFIDWMQINSDSSDFPMESRFSDDLSARRVL